jgi:hypothetical protein
MSDHFERAKDDILLRTNENGGPTPKDLLIAMQALGTDVDEAVGGLERALKANHVETKQLAARNLNLIERHLTDNVHMTNPEFKTMISALESEHVEIAGDITRIESDIVEIKDNYSQLRRREPRRKDDSETEDFGKSWGQSKVPRMTRESIVANFWILVAVVATNSVVTYLIVYLLNWTAAKGTP